MAERLKDSYTFPTCGADEPIENRERHGKRKAVSARFEVGVATAVRSAAATRDAAIRRARKLAHTEKVEVIVCDRMARPGAQSVWLFNEDGLIRAILRRGRHDKKFASSEMH